MRSPQHDVTPEAREMADLTAHVVENHRACAEGNRRRDLSVHDGDPADMGPCQSARWRVEGEIPVLNFRVRDKRGAIPPNDI